jgi:hypothetical protein
VRLSLYYYCTAVFFMFFYAKLLRWFRVYVRCVQDLRRGLHPDGPDDRLLRVHALPRPLLAATAQGQGLENQTQKFKPKAVFRIHDILEWIRIRGSMPLTN